MSHNSLALLTPEDCAVMDSWASAHIPQLMENAGRAVARAIRQRFSPCRVVVACGPGNNGGDGYVAARHLSAAGWSVRVARIVPPRVDSHAAVAASRWTGPLVALNETELSWADVVVDAMFGAGLTRPLEQCIGRALAAATTRVAVDIPSGVNGATGEVWGNVAPCELTVTFVRRKPGHVMHPGRGLCGEVLCAEIGFPDAALQVVPSEIWHNVPGLWVLPEQKADDHKYSRGVVSLCGGKEMPGAARLAARAARRTGAGLVRISAGEGAQSYRLGDPGLVVDDGSLKKLLEDHRRHVWICGPGLTLEEAAQVMPTLVGAGRCVLADAGALSWGAEDLARLRGVAAMTPHIGEFVRLFGRVDGDRIAAARQAAKKMGCVVVMKGADTLIAEPGGRVAVNDHASPVLATAGSGDTLTGVIAALLAAGMSAWDACCAGVWLHGEAGIRAGELYGGWPVAEDLDALLGEARKRATELQTRYRNEHVRI